MHDVAGRVDVLAAGASSRAPATRPTPGARRRRRAAHRGSPGAGTASGLRNSSSGARGRARAGVAAAGEAEVLAGLDARRPAARRRRTASSVPSRDALSTTTTSSPARAARAAPRASRAARRRCRGRPRPPRARESRASSARRASGRRVDQLARRLRVVARRPASSCVDALAAACPAAGASTLFWSASREITSEKCSSRTRTKPNATANSADGA